MGDLYEEPFTNFFSTVNGQRSELGESEGLKTILLL
jgi:hypothetical protein